MATKPDLRKIARRAVTALALAAPKARVSTRSPRKGWQILHVNFHLRSERAAIQMLVDGAVREGFKRFRVMSPTLGAERYAIATTKKVSVRAMEQYDILWDESYLRIDVIGKA